MPVRLVVSLSDSYYGSVYNKGSSTIDKADWCVNRYLQSNQLAGRRVEEGGGNSRFNDRFPIITLAMFTL